MKCPLCKGEMKKVIRWTADQPRYLSCERCNGTGEVESITNMEWIQSMSVEELANFLLRIFGNCGWCRDGGNPKFCPTDFENSCLFEDDGLVKWLKEEHKF